MYDPSSLPLPHNFDRDVNTLPGRQRAVTNAYDMGNATPDMLRRVKALYAGSISLIDKGVGRILDTLDELGLADDTMVVFVSDHGEMMGDHGMWQKGIPYEASVRVPMLVRLPGRVQAGAVNDDLVINKLHVDIILNATFCLKCIIRLQIENFSRFLSHEPLPRIRKGNRFDDHGRHASM